MEAIVLLIKKLVGVGMVGAIGVTGVSVSGEAFNTVKDYLLAAATPDEYGWTDTDRHADVRPND